MDSDVRTTRKRRRPKSGLISRVRWSSEDRQRLIDLKDQHSDLDWNQFHDLGLFPGRTPRALQWAYDRATGIRVTRRNGSRASKRPTSPSFESLDERQRKKLRRGEEEDTDYDETSSEEEASDDSEESSCESSSEHDEPESKNDTATANRPNRMQSSEKPYPWNITTSTPSGPVHISAAPGPSTGICGRSESANTQNRARQDNSSPSGKKARETKLAGPCKTPASQSLLQAAHALEQQESNLNALEARQESQNSYLKEELDRLRQEIAGMKRRNTHLEKTVEDLRSSRQAEMEEALLRQIHKRLNDSDELYKERFKELKHEVDEMKIKETTEIKPGLESVQKRVELLERFFKKLSAFDLLEKLQVEDANG